MAHGSDALRPTLVHLTGPHRGTSDAVDDPALVGTAPTADIRFPACRATDVARQHLELRREDDGWHFRAAPRSTVFVNGEVAASGRLLAGDVVQLGRDGPLLRFRLQPGGDTPYKSLRDALADCVACARYGADSIPARAGLLLEAMPRELFTRTSPRVRALMATGILLGLALSGYQVVESRALGDRLSETKSRLEAVAATLRAERQRPTVTAAFLDSVRRSTRSRREAPVADRPTFLAEASGSVILVEGAYAFEDRASGRRLRVRRDTGRDGAPSSPEIAPDAEGRALVRHFTGTAFAVTPEGHFVTNRHLLRPWRQDRVAKSLGDSRFRPVLQRLTGYLPGREEPVELEIVVESDSADVALLHAPGLPDAPPALPLADGTAEVGDDVYLLGYPTGLRALLARSDPDLVAELRQDVDERSPAAVLDRLADEKAISPLTTRGIVGQVTASAVVYDAETSQGGSGGPVLRADGRVVAVNKGLMAEFGGSNIGVPARHVHGLLERAGIRRDARTRPHGAGPGQNPAPEEAQ